MKNYVITPEDFMSRKERQQLMKICKEHSELGFNKGTSNLAYSLYAC